MRFALVIPLAAAALTVAGASSLGDMLGLNLVATKSFGHHLLNARQINIPEQCQSICNPVIAAINGVRPVIDSNIYH